MMNNAAHLAAMTRNQNAMTDDDSGHSDEDAGSDMDINEDHKGVWSGGSQCSPNSNTSQGSTNGFTVNCDGMGNDSNSVANASDAEGVWSPDIEQAFQEAMQIYPPCGRRKIILSDEGRMYGRNELIARYIKLRTGKTRTRKQVSSHIQVLARKRSRELQAKLKDHGAKKQAINSLNNLSSAQIVNLHNKTLNVAPMGITLPNGLFNPITAGLWSTTGSEVLAGLSPPSTVSAIASSIQNQVPSDCIDVTAFNPLTFQMNQRNNNSNATLARFPGVTLPLASARSLGSPWEGRTLCTQKMRLCELSAYFLPNPSMPSHHHEMVHIDSNSITHDDPLLETIDITQIFDKFPTGKDGLRDFYQRSPESGYFLVKFWADMSFKCVDEQAAVFAVDSRFESTDNFTISVSTKVCSFGKQVVEKVEHEYPKCESGRFVYRIQRSPMCEYMNNFIHKLRKLPERHLMNSVLENFTILQIVSNKETQEILLCLAFVFEISDGDGPQNRMYKLNYFPTQHSNK